MKRLEITTRHRLMDGLVAGALAVGFVVSMALNDKLDEPLWLNLVIWLPATIALLFRRHHALPVALVVGAVVVVAAPLLTTEGPRFFQTATVVIASYSGGAFAGGRRAWIALAGPTVGMLTTTIVQTPTDIAFPVGFFCVVPWIIGRTIRSQTLLARELAEKAELEELAREQEERGAVAAERSRVARELHDVLAHDLSVMTIQASAARRIAARDPAGAAQSAGLIEQTGREALAELRQLFGPVHRGEAEGLEGQPGLQRVDRLAVRAREAGLPVELDVQGEHAPLPAGVDLAAFRVVQEGLTNAIKHAGDARAYITIRYSPADVTVEVADDGVGPGASETPRAPGGGHGLVGMRERVAVYGGELTTGRRRGGGFAVRARLPLTGSGS